MSGNLEQEAVEPMDGGGLGQEHHGAVALDERYTAFPAEIGRGLAGPADPNPPHAGLGALFERSQRGAWRGHEECSLHRRLDLTHLRKRAAALEFVRVWIDRHGVVATRGEFPEDHPGIVYGGARHPHHGQTLAPQKIVDCLLP